MLAMTSSENFGEWPSPITPELMATRRIGFGHRVVDNGILYWLEIRPEEDRRVIQRSVDGHVQAVTPDEIDVRAGVNLGGGDFTVDDGTIYFPRASDQRVYRQDLGEEPVAITPEAETDRRSSYADFEVSVDGASLYCVGQNVESNEEDDGPVITLMRVDVRGVNPPSVVASGHDFYTHPRISPDGSRIAWLTWDHPGMPWDGTELHVAVITSDGTLTNEQVVMGGPKEAVFQPEWRQDGTLHAVSDRSGWWNLYRYEEGEWIAYREEEAEYGVPMWYHGLRTYDFLDDGNVVALPIRDGAQAPIILGDDGDIEVIDLPFEAYGGDTVLRFHSDGAHGFVSAAGPRSPPRLIRFDQTGEVVTIRHGMDIDVDEAYLSEPEHLAVHGRDGTTVFGFFYPPTNPDVELSPTERPPLIVYAHGGPTGWKSPRFDLKTQFFTSRGFAVAHVNYRGSIGYGRSYREALNGNFGITDAEDCIDFAEHLASTGRIDGERMAIQGDSAGGLIALSALAHHDTFDAGVSGAGLHDLVRIKEVAPKFLSSYHDGLIALYPDEKTTYEERSPVNNADGIDVPLLLIQGAEDQLVPLSQAESMADALRDRGIPHVLLVLENANHAMYSGPDARERIARVKLAFYQKIFGLDSTPEESALESLVSEDVLYW